MSTSTFTRSERALFPLGNGGVGDVSPASVSAAGAGGGAALGKNTNSVSGSRSHSRSGDPAKRLRDKSEASLLRLYALRWAAQEVLASVDEKVPGKRYTPNTKTTGEVVMVEDSVYHRQIGCGNRRIQEFVGIRRNAGGSHYYDGVLVCGSLWPCPVCSAKIRRKRAANIQQAAVRWLGGWDSARLDEYVAVKEPVECLDGSLVLDTVYRKRRLLQPELVKVKDRAPGSLVFLTLTVKHERADELAKLFDAVMAGWREGIWQGRKAREIKDELGIHAWIRATEVTVGKNGWHPHLHILLFLDGECDDDRLRLIEAEFYARWCDAVDVQGLKSIRTKHGREHAVTVEHVGDEDGLARYLCKVEGLDPEHKGGWGVGNEMSRSDLKKGRVVIDSNDKDAPTVSITQLLEIIADHLAGKTCPADGCLAGVCSEFARAWACYLEYVKVTQNRRAIEWSRYLKKELGIDEKDSEKQDQADAEDAPSPLESLTADLSPDDWRLIIRHRAQADVLIAANRMGKVAVDAALRKLARKS